MSDTGEGSISRKHGGEGAKPSLELLIASLDIPLWMMNERREILFVNRSGVKLLGRPAADIHGRRCHELLHGTDHPIDGCPFEEALKNRRTGRLEMNARGKDLEALVDPVTDEEGRLVGLAHTLLDIGAHKRSCAEQKTRAEETERQKREMQDLLLLAAHDIRTPLTCIHGYAGFLETDLARLAALLEDGRPGEDTRFAALEAVRSIARDSLGPITEGAKHISRLLESVGKVARAGYPTLTLEKLDTADLLRGLMGFMEWQASRAGARIELKELPPCTADRDALGQIFSNLLGNALKFRDKARPLVVTVSGTAEGNSVLYQVKDNGAGIQEEDLPKIWGLFFSRPGTEGGNGEGVGLTMARRLAEASGGRLWAESQHGKGSTFFLRLPR